MMAEKLTAEDIRDVLVMLDLGDLTDEEAIAEILALTKEAGADVEDDSDG